jgi:hypothetical protein
MCQTHRKALFRLVKPLSRLSSRVALNYFFRTAFLLSIFLTGIFSMMSLTNLRSISS